MRFPWLLVLIAACGDDGSNAQLDAAPNPDDALSDADSSTRRPDPNDPVADVPMHTGAYTFGKLTSDEPSSPVQNGTWFNDDLTEHKVTDSETRYARYR